jgi:hypothetical protein
MLIHVQAGGNGNPWGATSPPWTTPQTGQQGTPGWGGWNGYKPNSGSPRDGGDDDDDDEKKMKNRPVESRKPPAEESADDEDQEERRRKGKARVVGPAKRQAPDDVAPSVPYDPFALDPEAAAPPPVSVPPPASVPPPPPAAPPASAAGPAPISPPAPVAAGVTARVVATWKAPKGNIPRVRRTLRDGGLLGRRQSNVTAPAVGGCCGNALWWD